MTLNSIQSQAQLDAMAIDSVACPAYSPESIFQKQAPNEWVGPGSDEVWSTEAVWEWATGTYEDLVMDEDREMWVVYDAAAPKQERPPRPAGTHDWATRMESREPVYVTHSSRDDALAAIAAEIGDGETAGRTNLWARPQGDYVFRSHLFFPPGTKASDLPT
jgi:hypothetical protein